MFTNYMGSGGQGGGHEEGGVVEADPGVDDQI